MVTGMFKGLLGSFVIVFLMMLILFRSFGFALLAMLPLSVTIAFIYGFIGLVGKDYDMPVAVLSSLTLGLSVDFAIHFLQRARAVHQETGNWRRTVDHMFAEPARAIARTCSGTSLVHRYSSLTRGPHRARRCFFFGCGLDRALRFAAGFGAGGLRIVGCLFMAKS